jgi:hypothetical protein
MALPYLRTSVLNGCRSVHRWRRVRGGRALHEPAAASAESAVLAREEQHSVLVAIRRLPARQREALILRFYLHEPETEVARVMGIARCLEAHGVPATFATQTSRSSDPLFYGYYAWADSLAQSATSSARIQADQRHETRIFVTCARPVVSDLEQIQLPRRAAFFRQHATEIARISQLAEQMGS